MMYIDVRYSCNLCGLEDVVVSVPARESELDPLMEWWTMMLLRVGENHRIRSPQCQTKSLQRLKIPMGKATKWVGGVDIQ